MAAAKLDQSLSSIISSNKKAQQHQSKPKQQSNASNGSATKRQENQKADRQQKQQLARQANGQNRQTQQQQQPRQPKQQQMPLQQIHQQVPMNFAQYQQQYPGQIVPGVYHQQQPQQQAEPQSKPVASAPIGGTQKIVGDEVFITGLATDLIGDDLREIFHSVGGVVSCNTFSMPSACCD
jgi:FtsZ-interacting cell division protein ZipA